MQERYTFLASLYEVMEGNGVAISDDTRTAANMIVKVTPIPLDRCRTLIGRAGIGVLRLDVPRRWTIKIDRLRM